MREAIQIRHESVGNYQRQWRHGSFSFAVFGEYIALHRHFLRTGETAYRYLRVVRPGRAHADIGAEFRGLVGLSC